MKGTLVRAAAAAALLVVAVTAQATGRPPQGGVLTSTLAVDSWQGKLAGDIAIGFTLSNSGTATARVPRWQTPLDGIEADIFEVTVDGEAVPYVGRLIKRAAPEAADFIELAPGDTVSVVFDPSAAYDMSRRGEYAVRYRVDLQGRDGLGPLELPAEGGGTARDRIESNQVRLWVEGVDEDRGLDVSAATMGGTTNCTNTQKTTLTTALTNATSISTKGYNYLVRYGNSTRYRYWFGAYASSRLATVKSHFSSIKGALASKPIAFDCGCKENYYAYVYPTQPYKVYVCKAFWTAPALGRDSKAGTIVHEVSHFNVVAKTQDYVYGAAGAHSLALTSPSKAIANADNHEYFAEDQP